MVDLRGYVLGEVRCADLGSGPGGQGFTGGCPYPVTHFITVQGLLLLHVPLVSFHLSIQIASPTLLVTLVTTHCQLSLLWTGINSIFQAVTRMRFVCTEEGQFSPFSDKTLHKSQNLGASWAPILKKKKFLSIHVSEVVSFCSELSRSMPKNANFLSSATEHVRKFQEPLHNNENTDNLKTRDSFKLVFSSDDFTFDRTKRPLCVQLVEETEKTLFARVNILNNFVSINCTYKFLNLTQVRRQDGVSGGLPSFFFKSSRSPAWKCVWKIWELRVQCLNLRRPSHFRRTSLPVIWPFLATLKWIQWESSNKFTMRGFRSWLSTPKPKARPSRNRVIPHLRFWIASTDAQERPSLWSR